LLTLDSTGWQVTQAWGGEGAPGKRRTAGSGQGWEAAAKEQLGKELGGAAFHHALRTKQVHSHVTQSDPRAWLCFRASDQAGQLGAHSAAWPNPPHLL